MSPCVPATIARGEAPVGWRSLSGGACSLDGTVRGGVGSGRGSRGTVIRGQAEFCLKCEWANFHRAPSTLGEVPGAAACQGSSLKRRLPSKNIKSRGTKKKRKKRRRHASCISWRCFSFVLSHRTSAKFININEQNVYKAHAPPCEAPTRLFTSLFV